MTKRQEGVGALIRVRDQFYDNQNEQIYKVYETSERELHAT